jgi:hypothetical protein
LIKKAGGNENQKIKCLKVKVAETPEVENRATLITCFYSPLLVEIKFFRHPLLSDTRFIHKPEGLSLNLQWIILVL